MMRFAALLCALMLAQASHGEPGSPLAKMMKTPASAFDLFLFRLYESGKCNNVVKNNNADEADLCLTSIKYDYDENILTAFFRVLPAAEPMDDFVEVEADERKAILLELLDNTARRFGAVDTWGLLHSTPVSQGESAGSADEKSFRAALAQRTTTALSTSYDGVVYIATRHHDGRVEYFTSK